jgi:hypothetical protein
MKNDNINSNKIKENKYKILRMSLLLGNDEDKTETINNFEDASREIDAMNDEIYLNDLEKKFYDTLTLEEEEKKLTDLVDYIGGRVEQRLSLLSDFSNVTGFELEHLPPIKYYDRLEEYKERLSYIREYLTNTKKINELNSEISDLENNLNTSYLNKAESEEQNIKDEKELLNRFNNIIRNIPEFKEVTLENIEEKLSNIISEVEDSKKSLDIFNTSFTTLNQAGISEEEKQEYQSYVNNAKEVYYNNKELEYLFKLYILFNRKEAEYSNIITKRESINEIIYDRMELRKELNINNVDKLSSMYDLLEKQYNVIKKQKENIENIEIFNDDINMKKSKVKELEEDNQKVEILSLLKEFCIIDTYEEVESSTKELSLDEIKVNIDTNIKNDSLEPTAALDNNTMENQIEVPTQSPPQEEKKEVEEPLKNENNISVSIEKAKDNEVISIKDASKINIEAAIKKSNNVMKRVGEMLGVKVGEPNEEVTSIPAVKNEEQSVTKNEESSSIPVIKNEESKVSNPVQEPQSPIDNNIFTNTSFDADPESNNGSEITPSNDYQTIEKPLFNNTLSDSTIDEVMSNNNINESKDNEDFWFSNEESPLDLNSLPDLPTSNDSFFTPLNDTSLDLNFPNLNLPVNNDKEEQ